MEIIPPIHKLNKNIVMKLWRIFSLKETASNKCVTFVQQVIK